MSKKEIFVVSTPLKVLDYSRVPLEAKEFFPHPEEGFIFLNEREDDCVDVYCKYYDGKEVFIETVERNIADNMISSVKNWNRIS